MNDMTGNTYEIERRFLIRCLPADFERYSGDLLEQGYLFENGEAEEPSRIRIKKERYTLTRKTGAGLVRTEDERTMSRVEFEQLWPETVGRRLAKIRYRIPFNSHTIELDIYQGTLEGFRIAEVEFSSVEESRLFSPPDWFGAEVTENAAFNNYYFALHGIPAEIAALQATPS